MSVISDIGFPLYLLRQQAVVHQLLGEIVVPIGMGANGWFRGCSWNRIIASHHRQNPTFCRPSSILFETDRQKNGAKSCRTLLPPRSRSYTAATRMGNFDDAMVLQNLDELRRFDASPTASLASHDFVSLLESAFSLTVFARLFLFSDALPHVVLQIWLRVPHRCRRG